MRHALRTTLIVLAVGGPILAAGCSDDDGDQDRITRIEGPAQVDDEVTPEQSPDE